jgi:hypothetical protein
LIGFFPKLHDDDDDDDDDERLKLDI